jgi:hypothetical protein
MRAHGRRARRDELYSRAAIPQPYPPYAKEACLPLLRVAPAGRILNVSTGRARGTVRRTKHWAAFAARCAEQGPLRALPPTLQTARVSTYARADE